MKPFSVASFWKHCITTDPVRVALASSLNSDADQKARPTASASLSHQGSRSSAVKRFRQAIMGLVLLQVQERHRLITRAFAVDAVHDADLGAVLSLSGRLQCRHCHQLLSEAIFHALRRNGKDLAGGWYMSEAFVLAFPGLPFDTHPLSLPCPVGRLVALTDAVNCPERSCVLYELCKLRELIPFDTRADTNTGRGGGRSCAGVLTRTLHWHRCERYVPETRPQTHLSCSGSSARH